MTTANPRTEFKDKLTNCDCNTIVGEQKERKKDWLDRQRIEVAQTTGILRIMGEQQIERFGCPHHDKR